MIATLLASLLVLLQATTQPAAPPAPPAPPAVVYDTGPLKAEITAMREIRLKYMDSPERSAQESNFAMQVRISGEKLGKIRRFGSLLLTEAVDDRGASMLDPNTYTEQDRTAMRPQMMPIERLREQGLLVATRASVSSRGATNVAKLKGAIKLVLSDKTEKFTILNPYQHLGSAVDDPRLKALGIELRVLPVAEVEAPTQPQRCLVVQFAAKSENIQSVAFFDGSMQPVRHRENPAKSKAGADVTVYCLDGGTFTNETTMVLEVHPEVEVVDLPIEVENLGLP